MKTKLTITSTEDHYFVDGPETRRANLLNECLLLRVNLDTLPPGEYEFYHTGLGFESRLVKIDGEIPVVVLGPPIEEGEEEIPEFP